MFPDLVFVSSLPCSSSIHLCEQQGPSCSAGFPCACSTGVESRELVFSDASVVIQELLWKGKLGFCINTNLRGEIIKKIPNKTGSKQTVGYMFETDMLGGSV